MAFKGVILGIDGVLLSSKQGSGSKRSEVLKLLKFLLSKDIEVAVLANHSWTVGQEPADEYFSMQGIDISWFIASRDYFKYKPQKESVEHVLARLKLKPTEVVYLGNTETDMKTAVNSRLLFLNASWFGKQHEYGIECKTPLDVARFVEVFCLRKHFWHYEIKNGPVEFYALGTYGTMEQKYAHITNDAKEAAKFGRGHPDFWIPYLLSTAYFSGLHERVSYITTYPSSQKGSKPSIIYNAVDTIAKSLRKPYIPDLIVRHKSAQKSAYARANGGSVDQYNQINSIHLNSKPLKSEDTRYVKSPLKTGKCVLVIDDFCTQGFSLEAARVFVERTGATTIGLALLKTINRDYVQINGLSPKSFDPYAPRTFNGVQQTSFPYQDGIVDSDVHTEIEQKLDAFDNWKWPKGL